MHDSTRDLASLFGVSERAVLRWIHKDGLPARPIQGSDYVHRLELLEWAIGHAAALPPAVLPRLGGVFSGSPCGLAGGLRRGCVRHARSHDLAAAQRALIAGLNIPEGSDHEALDQAASGRGLVVGGGIAIPHVLRPLIVPRGTPAVALLLLPEPFDSLAGDGQPVQAVFELVTPTARTHLQLLADLALALCDPVFRGAITHHAPAAQIIAEAERIDRMIADLVGGVPAERAANSADGVPTTAVETVLPEVGTTAGGSTGASWEGGR
jgi:PTS system nitrogen regulatory IIA component